MSGTWEPPLQPSTMTVTGPIEALNKRVEVLEAEVAWLKRIISELETGGAEMLRGPNGVR